jgi:hypothetical protein
MANLSDKILTSSINSAVTLANSAVQLNDSPTFVTVNATTVDATTVDATTVNATTVDLGVWTVTETAGVLYFAVSGVNKIKCDSNGDITTVGNVTAYGTV